MKPLRNVIRLFGWMTLLFTAVLWLEFCASTGHFGFGMIILVVALISGMAIQDWIRFTISHVKYTKRLYDEE